MSEEETVCICDYCNEPTEEETIKELGETSYGGGHLVSETETFTGSKCCGSDCYVWPLWLWIYEFPTSALAYGYITKKEYDVVIKDLEELNE